MRTEATPRGRGAAGYALMLTLFLIGVSLVVMASAVKWTSTETVLTSRNNVYNTTVAGAEAATERVLAQMQRDFTYQSVSSDLNTYSVLLPAQDGWPMQFEFSDGAGNVGRTRVLSRGPSIIANLNSEFAGLYGLVSPYQVISRARPLSRPYNLAATVSQEFQLARIPIFQFAIFYALDLEINPGAPMTVTGKVHGNKDIYTAPPASLTYADDVTAVGSIYNNRHTNDPTGGGKTAPVYQAEHMNKVSSLTLPVGTNNSPQAVQQILDVPPWDENPNSLLGKQRFYNNADLIISNSPSGQIIVKSGLWNNFANVPPDGSSGGNPYYTFVTNATFYDYREDKTIQATQIDVERMLSWLTNTTVKGGAALNGTARAQMNHELNSIYAIDNRPGSSSTLPAVRVVNGITLPQDGLTVATPRPLYVKGHFNLNNGNTTAGLTNTANTKPAALIGDAITVLSPSWQDSFNSSTALGSRTAANTTVNAAFLAGIVESARVGNSRYYSGGVENFPRFLENWSTKSLTYNGSMVAMFPSRLATNFWVSPGSYYNPPARRWAFDLNFLNANRLPPMTPQVRKLVRGQWRVLASSGG